MKKAYISIGIVTAILFIYVTAIRFNVVPLAVFIFSLSPLLVIWMVYTVLKAPVKVEQGFEEGKTMYCDPQVR